MTGNSARRIPQRSCPACGHWLMFYTDHDLPTDMYEFRISCNGCGAHTPAVLRATRELMSHLSKTERAEFLDAVEDELSKRVLSEADARSLIVACRLMGKQLEEDVLGALRLRFRESRLAVDFR